MFKLFYHWMSLKDMLNISFWLSESHLLQAFRIGCILQCYSDVTSKKMRERKKYARHLAVTNKFVLTVDNKIAV